MPNTNKKPDPNISHLTQLVGKRVKGICHDDGADPTLGGEKIYGLVFDDDHRVGYGGRGGERRGTLGNSEAGIAGPVIAVGHVKAADGRQTVAANSRMIKNEFAFAGGLIF
jgi:hypothetical protein